MQIEKTSNNFLRNLIEEDLQNNKYQEIITRFPPEPNGYLHIGHAKSICLNFGLAKEFNGKCNLRFDDTNPSNEEVEYIEAIKKDIQWLGFKWNELHFASDYFDKLYEWAIYLIKNDKAFVCDLTAEQMREYRGDFQNPGKDSPYKNRSIEENLDLLERMKNGEFADGEKSLRAKIDMSHPNINMRDPVLYRIKHIKHHQTGDKWCIYPSYDFTHGQSDSLEHITHSMCTLEFADHRPLYNWFIATLPTPSEPHQYEFARLNLNYTITSKRKLKKLVEEKVVNGWDDPRLSTLSGFRRRGVPPQAIINFCEMIGVNKQGGVVDVSELDFCIREYLDVNAKRAMCVLNPLKVILTNVENDEILHLHNHPKNDLGEREVVFSKEIYIDKNDFQEIPEKGYKRLSPNEAVRLRGSYVIKVTSFEKDASGEISTIYAEIDQNTLGKNPEGYKAKGVIHWVSTDSQACEVRLYDRLFNKENPEEGELLDNINENSLIVNKMARAENSLLNASLEDRFQFEREGYFCLDYDSSKENLIFNRIINLKGDRK